MAQTDSADYVVQLEPDNIISLAWHPGVHVEAANARDAVDAVNRTADGQRYPLLVRMAAPGHLSRAARDVFVEPCAATRIALLGSNPVDRMLADYQLAAQPAPCPTRFFTSEEEALRWLHEPSEELNHKGRTGSMEGTPP